LTRRGQGPVGQGYDGRMLGLIESWEILVPLVLIVVFFGGSQIPKLARSLGSAQKEFKKGLEEGAKDDDDSDKKSEKS